MILKHNMIRTYLYNYNCSHPHVAETHLQIKKTNINIKSYTKKHEWTIQKILSKTSITMTQLIHKVVTSPQQKRISLVSKIITTKCYTT